MIFCIVQKNRSEAIFDTIALEKMFILIIKQMDIVAGNIDK